LAGAAARRSAGFQIKLGGTTSLNRSADELQVTLSNRQKASGDLQLASSNLPGISDALGKRPKISPGWPCKRRFRCANWSG
jgi:hypothetical protein